MGAPTILACAALFLLTGAASLSAQAARTDLIGSRVRVTLAPTDPAAASRVVVGDVLAVSDSTLSLRSSEATPDETVATSRIQRFEMRTGRNHAAGARFGALVGLASGLVLGLALGDDCSTTDGICFDRSDTAAGGALLGAGLGMTIGLVAGRGDRWREAPMPSRLSVIPRSGGTFMLAASISF